MSLRRTVCAWSTMLALILGPVIVQLTHGPAAAMAADETSWYGNTLNDIAGDFCTIYDVADHEHQITGLVNQIGSLTGLDGMTRRPVSATVQSALIRDGPRRPPRFV